MSQTIAIRQFHPNDADAIAALFRDTVHRINRRDYSAEQLLAWAPMEIDPARWADKLASRFSPVALLGRILVGFSDLEANGHLDHLFVHADYQGIGIASALVNAIHAEAQRCKLTRVFTEASITAQPFFSRQGYRILARQEVVCRGVSLTNFRMEKEIIY